jgi:hypothetical protein
MNRDLCAIERRQSAGMNSINEYDARADIGQEVLAGC